MFKILNGREHFYQWDSDQKVIVEDVDCNEVHFCNRTDDCSLVCQVYEENGLRVADVPNILLQNDWPLNVYAFCHDFTKISKTFKVISRTKPADYVYTETEVLNYNTLAEKIDKIDQNIGQAVEDYLTEHPVVGGVSSVNSKTGDVELTAEDVGAATEDYVDKAVKAIELTPGPKGDTPVKGTDYWTAADKQEMVTETLNSIPLATTETAGKVKPDGTTITIDEDGTIHGSSSVEEVKVSDTEPTDPNVKLWVDTTAQQPSYATEEWVENKGYLTEHQSLDGYAKTTDIPDVSGFTTMTAVEAKGYQTADQVQSAINTALGVIENGSY